MPHPSLGSQASARFRIEGEIGRGGIGVVYRAHDNERGHAVALKALQRRDPQALFELKNEFRVLAGIHHVNLITLHELFADSDAPFFTMELLTGTDVRAFCARDDASVVSPADDETMPRDMASDEARVRAVLAELCAGLEALHAGGVLHRDLKPSNVWVTEQGTVKILDFGLAMGANVIGYGPSGGAILGTPSYMSPEQARGEPELEPASDCYAVGVILYELLTGALPLSGAPLQILIDKQTLDPIPARRLRPRIPSDLAELCDDLLARDPDRRPSPAAALARLGHTRPARPRFSGPLVDRPLFAGRERDLAALSAAFARIGAGDPQVVMVRGPSGIGKSTLVREFLSAAQVDDLVVLGGRCYERETVPFRAMDGVIDELSRFWDALPDAEAGALLPLEPGRLRQLFPVLGRVGVVDRHRAPDPAPDRIEDPETRRLLGYRMLRETFRRLTSGRRLVVFVDDVQWLDAESVNLLSDLLRPPHPPRLLLVLASRDYPSEATPALTALLARLGAAVERIELGPLRPYECQQLARQLAAGATPTQITRIAEESDGNPFFLAELARHVATNDTPDHALTLDAALVQRIADLPAAARAVLESVAVAVEPVHRSIARDASTLDGASFEAHLTALRAASLVRASSGLREDHVEPYHDRIREVVVGQLTTDELITRHRRLAVALEGSDTAHPEQLARHWRGAGESARAAVHARAAAEDAVAETDYDRAAGWYRMAIELGELSSEEARALWTRYGDTLAAAGRPRTAAEAYERALAGASVRDALELRRRIMEQLLGGGYVEPGLRAARELLADVGLPLPRSPAATIARIAGSELALRLRGYRSRPRLATELANDDLERFDIAFTAATALDLVDTLRCALTVQRMARLALRVGEPGRVACALSMASGIAAVRGQRRHARNLLRHAAAAADRTESGLAAAWVAGARQYYAYCCDNDWTTAIDRGNEALEHVRATGMGRIHSTDTTLIVRSFARMYRGDLRALAEETAETVQTASRLGNRYLESTLRAAFRIRHLARDEPHRAHADLDLAASTLPPTETAFYSPHWFVLWGRGETALYTNEPAAANELMTAHRKVMARSLLLHIALIRCEYRHLQGRIKLAVAAATDDAATRRRLVRETRALARSLARESMPMGAWSAALLRAGAAHLAGDRDAAEHALRAAVALLDRGETQLFAMAARRQLGVLTAGDAGAALIHTADEWMRGEGCVQPARIAAMLVPGWPYPAH